jgi:glucose-6-phosphate-specific signal transduction histidine kinase
MDLQRQRLAQTQVLDPQARRILHDDILPNLHAAMLMLTNDRPPTADHRPPSGEELSTLQLSNFQPSNLPSVATSQPSSPSPISLLADIHRQISDLLREMPAATTPDVARLGVIEALHRVVEHELPSAFDEVTWQIEPEAKLRAHSLPELTAEVLFYAAREAIRNAARHGRAETTESLHLQISLRWRQGLELVIEDNGVGLPMAGLSTGGSSRPSSGQGLALHSTMMAVVGGTLAVESAPGVYTRVSLTLPPVG